MDETKEIKIEWNEDAEGGRYWMRLESGEEAYLSYTHAGENIISINHTMVPRAFRGHGVAQKLVNRAIADAKANDRRIVPVCSYVEAQFRRHKEWAPLRA